MRSALVLALVLVSSVSPFCPSAGAAPADELYRAGVAARLEKRFDEAAGLLARASRLQPDNADIWVQLGLALSVAGKRDAARSAFEKAIFLAPDYVDAHLGLARLAFWRGDLAEAGERLATARRCEPDNKEVAILDQQVAAARAAARVWRLDIGGNASDLSDALPAWTEGSVALSRKIGPNMTVAALVKMAERFGATDSYFEGRLDYRFSDRFGARLFAGATPDADFLPEYAAGVGASLKVGADDGRFGPSVLSADIAYFRYRDDAVVRIDPALQHYLLGGRAWLTLQLIATSSNKTDWSGGYVVRGDLRLADGVRVFAGLGDAPDLSGGTVIASRSLFGGVAIALSDRVSAVLSLSRTDLEGSYSRQEAAVGISVAF